MGSVCLYKLYSLQTLLSGLMKRSRLPGVVFDDLNQLWERV